MVRSLWTAATGMAAQQRNVDVISNNLANSNTIGFKKETAEFKSLLYQTIQDKSTDNNGDAKPISAQVGLGVRNSAISSSFSQGAFIATGNDLDFAISGDGLFAVGMPDGSVGFTRNGSFSVAVEDNGAYTIATSDGYPLLDTQGNKIVLDSKYSSALLNVDSQGQLTYPDETNNAQPIGVQIGLFQFTNPSGLTKSSDSILLESVASGPPISENTTANVSKSVIRQGYIEQSNVEAIDEMVNLIVAQRAYELSSKIITASDQMMQQANNLR